MTTRIMMRPSSHPLASRLIVVSALLLFFALAAGAALDKSPTRDEPIHLLRGAALRQSGDFSLQYEHAPLSHWLIGSLLGSESTLPAVAGLASRPSGNRSDMARELVWQRGLNVDRALFLGRLPIIYAGLLLGAALALWVRAATGGHRPALAVTMAFFAASSNLLASAALATTDLVATTTYFATVCAWWFYWRRPGRRLWLLTGALLGLALASKLTGVLLVPVLVTLAYVYPPRRPWWRPGLIALGLLPVAGLTLWAVYLFQIGPWRGITLPAPAYWDSWASVLSHVSDGHQSFFLGEVSTAGWWSYFPVTLLLKTPLPALALFAVGLGGLWRARAWQMTAFLLLPMAAILAAAMYSRLNIGYRHVLPLVPFALVAAGLAVRGWWARPAGRWAAGLVAAWAVGAALWVHPHHLAYFNELAGGPARGYRYLGDSNLDWGQDLRGLADYAAGVTDTLYIAYAGVSEPAYYGLEEPSLAGPEGLGRPDFHPANPAPGRYAISASHIQGLLAEADLFDWFRRREPDDTIGYSILIYNVAEARPGEWIAHCLMPGRLLTDEAAEQLVGLAGARHAAFDCESSWVFPQDGAPGWYILPARAEEWWVNAWLGEMKPELVYGHRANAYGPDYAVYYWPGGVEPGATMGGEAQTYAGESGGPAALRAYGARAAEWVTLWRVAEATAAPLSVQAHLADAAGAMQVADGLGFSSDQWRPGDWFLQRHVFAAPGEVLETGLYNYATLEPAGPTIRLPVDRP
ncbi:glycosyltransferase family 39 protein [Promineifilum sp.]|uniref:glycosyltransferase family 39 protein n=1 Tax=Promineifilum sp. TaxID=2664178 RepID=UPI0035B3DC0F